MPRPDWQNKYTCTCLAALTQRLHARVNEEQAKENEEACKSLHKGDTREDEEGAQKHATGDAPGQHLSKAEGWNGGGGERQNRSDPNELGSETDS